MVTIDGLPARITTVSNDLLSTSSVAYDLNFKDCPINDLRRKCFRIINHSKQYTYRFQFATVNCVKFIPAVGHLKPYFFKDIVCTVLTETPLVLNDQKIELLLCKVTYTDPQQKLLSWDERQNLIVWESSVQTQKDEIGSSQSEMKEGSIETDLYA